MREGARCERVRCVRECGFALSGWEGGVGPKGGFNGML